ncbi:aromatic compound degradation protein PaaI [Paractinoplanes deccanensis]|uniref:Aromatic compound degradation protein PaaI n=1 Tax=Paractinoplanes deccanensis TaxID=113561 RepID=A0ABQ3YCP3_9ACTN|nr:thioesterase family protein [Actinoplanes deccanensis]GID77776.1 aromatic compound degradation protein PaaI [Actinoplanes deccanensis]
MGHQFDADTVVSESGGRWAATISPEWAIATGVPNGGYLFAVALAAGARAVPEQRLVTATGHFVRPGQDGAADLAVEVVKRGRLTSTVSVALRQDDKERVRVVATYGDPALQEAPVRHPIAAPEIPGPGECVSSAGGLAGKMGVRVAERVDYRMLPGSRWIGGDGPGEARIDGWIRFADGREPDLAALPFFVDAFPPALGELVGPVTAPTLELTVHLRKEPAPGWLQARLEARHIAPGLVEEDAYLWDSAGELVALSRQLGLWRP